MYSIAWSTYGLRVSCFTQALDTMSAAREGLDTHTWEGQHDSREGAERGPRMVGQGEGEAKAKGEGKGQGNTQSRRAVVMDAFYDPMHTPG